MYKEFLNTAIEASVKASEIIKEGFRKEKTFALKASFDPVTEYDKKSEEVIKDFILKKYPKSMFVGEERGIEGEGEVKWIIDPIDGTVNFLHGLPFVAIVIGVEVEGEIVAGVINNPILGEVYYASKGDGAYKNNSRIYVSKISSPENALVVTGFPYKRQGRIEELLKPLRVFLAEYQGFRRLGSAALDLAYVASGVFEVFYEENLKPWDTSAGVIIVKEAGGKVTDYYGNNYNPFESKTILATNALIHERILEIVSKIKSI